MNQSENKTQTTYTPSYTPSEIKMPQAVYDMETLPNVIDWEITMNNFLYNIYSILSEISISAFGYITPSEKSTLLPDSVDYTIKAITNMQSKNLEAIEKIQALANFLANKTLGGKQK